MSKPLPKRKVLCPEKIHEKHKYEKILFGFEERIDKAPLVFYIHCDDIKCKTWHRIVFDEQGHYYVEPLKKVSPTTGKRINITFEKIPVPVKC